MNYLYISQPRYLPIDSWLLRVQRSNTLILLDDHFYSYTSYINRRYIQEKKHWLTIPIYQRKKNINPIINTLQICDEYYNIVKRKHIAFLEQNKTLYYKEYIESIKFLHTNNLFVFLYKHLIELFELLNINIQIVLASTLHIDYKLYKKTSLLLQLSKCFENSVLNISENMYNKYFDKDIFTNAYNILK